MLNLQHSRLKFTFEKVRVVKFFGIETKISNNGFECSVYYCKQSDIGLILKYHANCPKSCKPGLIMCLLHRAKLICWNVLLFNSEVRNPHKYFCKKNRYTNYFFDLTLKK